MKKKKNLQKKRPKNLKNVPFKNLKIREEN